MNKEEELDEMYPYFIVTFILMGIFLVSALATIVITRLQEINGA